MFPLSQLLSDPLHLLTHPTFSLMTKQANKNNPKKQISKRPVKQKSQN